MSLNISLTPELDRLVQEEVATGSYGDAGELVRDALRRFFSVDDWTALDQVVMPRLEAVEAGTAETVSFEEFKASGFAFIDDV
jgi:putative addiction module CopG family antidote